MNHDQQVLQLREFDQQVLSQADNAASFATKSFLENLFDLLNHGLEQEDDGTDTYKEELKVIKDATKAFSTVLPTVYKTICQNEAEDRLWELCRSLIALANSKLINHTNTGVQINAIKCLQVLVLLFSKSTLKSEHRLLNVAELEKEGQELFEMIIEKLNSDNESVLTATISCLVIIGKRRSQFLKVITNSFSTWRKTKSKDDSPVMLRNVDKALKLAFVSLIRTESLAPHRSELITAFGSIGGNVAMFQSRQTRAEESRRLKRTAAQQEGGDRHHHQEKKIKTEYVPTIPSASSPNILVNYDITQIPLSAIVNLCMTVLQTVPLEVMSERVSLLPPTGVTLAAARPGFVRSTTPPYPPPPDQPKYNTNPRYKTEKELANKKKEEPVSIKREEPVDSDEEMENSFNAPPVVPYMEEDQVHVVKAEEKPKVQILASAEERASQAFKMKPYELAKQKNELSDLEKKELLKMTIQRIFETEGIFQSNGIISDKRTITNGTTPTSSVWLLRMVKLITQGVQVPLTSVTEEAQEDQKFEVAEIENADELKESLLDFIVEKLSLRTDLALEWLHEEYLFDKRHSRLNPEYSPQYFYWFHKFLQKGIPTLDVKDRVLTKLLLEAPELNEETIELVKENLHTVPERFVPCVSTLRSLVTNRPAIRFIALQALLDLCINENDKIRRTSIVAVKKWNANQNDINTRVEEFSVESLNVLTTEKDVNMNEEKQLAEEGTEEQPSEEQTAEQKKDNAWTEKDVLRYAELYFVSCNKRPSLLKELFSVYIKASEQVQVYIQMHMVNMIVKIGMKSTDLNKLLSEFPPGGESLVIKILSILCESKPPTREIISIVQTISELAKERSIDVECLIPILEGHSLNYQAPTK